MQCATEVQLLIGRLTIETIVQRGVIAHLSLLVAQRDEKISQLLAEKSAA